MKRLIFFALILIAFPLHAGPHDDCRADLGKRPEPIALSVVKDAVLEDIVAKTLQAFVKQNSNAAFQVTEGLIRPTLERVADFIQRSSSPTKPIDKLRTEATKLYDDLAAAIERLRKDKPLEKDPKRFQFWIRGFGPKFIHLMRSNHQQLHAAAEKLRELTSEVDETIALSDDVAINLELTTQTTDQLIEKLSRDHGFDPEQRRRFEMQVLRRLIGLSESLRTQAILLSGFVAGLEQRQQLSTLIQDKIRTMLTIDIPVAAMAGPVPLDLSPLDPSDGGRRPIYPTYQRAKTEVESVLASKPEFKWQVSLTAYVADPELLASPRQGYTPYKPIYLKDILELDGDEVKLFAIEGQDEHRFDLSERVKDELKKYRRNILRTYSISSYPVERFELTLRAPNDLLSAEEFDDLRVKTSYALSRDLTGIYIHFRYATGELLDLR